MASQVQAVLEVVGNVLKQGDKLLSANEAWGQYKYEVNRFKSVLENQEETIKDLLEANLGLTREFNAAKEELEKAQKDLSKMEKHAHSCSPCWGCAKAYAFPKTLEKKTESIITITTNIDGAIVRARDQSNAAADLRHLEGIVPSDNPAPDLRFVPPRNYQGDVYNALKDFSESSPLIVFLHGEQGIGKSTFAWHIASEANKKDGSSEGHGSSFFFPVVKLITCGTSKKVESLFQELKVQLKLGAEASDAELSNRLEKTKKLIILDDVQDSNIPPEVVRLAGNLDKSVKFLITSNVGTVCEGCDSSRIKSIRLELDQFDKEDSKSILANHTGLKVERLTSENRQAVERIVDKVVEATRGHPLALACFSSRIQSDRVTEVREWETAWEDLDAALSDPSKANFHGVYPYSFVETMNLSLKDLGDDARNLLLLLLVLEGEAVLEEVPELLYVHLGFGDRGRFRKATAMLKQRYLISVKRADEPVIWIREYFFDRLQYNSVHTMEFHAWYVHPLRRKLVEEQGVPVENKTNGQLEETIAAITSMGEFIQTKLNGIGEVGRDTDEEDVLLTIICDFFVRNDFLPMGTPHYSGWLLRTILLLGYPHGDSWTKASYEAAKKMILFCCIPNECNVLDMTPLFQSDIAFAPMMELFEGYGDLHGEQRNVLAECHVQFLLEVLAEGIRTNMNEKSLHKIKHVVCAKTFQRSDLDRIKSLWQFQHLYMVQSYPLIIERISQVLTLCHDGELGIACCEFLTILSHKVFGTVAGRMSIIRCQKLMSFMVNSLIQKSHPHPDRLSVIVAVLSDLVTIEDGCKLVTEKEEPVTSLVQEWCNESGTSRYLDMVTDLLVNIAMDERGAQLISRHLEAVMAKFQRVLSRLSSQSSQATWTEAEMYRDHFHECMCLLSNLVAQSEEYCLLVMNADKLGTIFTLAGIPNKQMTERNITSWISLITNLARHSESRKQLQENRAVLCRLREVYENYGQDIVKESEKLEELQEWPELHGWSLYLQSLPVALKMREMREMREMLEPQVHHLQVVQRLRYLMELHRVKPESIMKLDNEKWDSEIQMYAVNSLLNHIDRIRREKRDDVLPGNHQYHERWALMSSWRACQTEVLTLLNLDNIVRACITRFEEMPEIQVMIYLARAKANLHQGELHEAAKDLEEAFNITLTQPFLEEFIAGKLLIAEHILRRQCDLMTAFNKLNKAHQKAIEMINFDPHTYFPTWGENKHGRDFDAKSMQMSGLIKRGMIWRILKRPGDALTDFDAALKVAATGLEVVATRLEVAGTQSDSINALYFHRASWQILRLRAEVKHISHGEDAAKEDLLAGAKHMWFASFATGISQLNPHPYYLDQMSSSSFANKFLNSDEIYMSSSKFVKEYLKSNEFYEAILANSSKIDRVMKLVLYQP